MRNLLINITLSLASIFFAVGIVFFWEYNTKQVGPQMSAEERIVQNAKIEGSLRQSVKLDKLNETLRHPLPTMFPLLISVPDMSRPSIVLFLAKDCHWCKESMPLYQKMLSLDAVKHGHILLVAVMPDKLDEAKKYLEDNKIRVHRMVVEQNLAMFGVSSTPTILFIKDGKIINGYVGAQRVEDVMKVAKTWS